MSDARVLPRAPRGPRSSRSHMPRGRESPSNGLPSGQSSRSDTGPFFVDLDSSDHPLFRPAAVLSGCRTPTRSSAGRPVGHRLVGIRRVVQQLGPHPLPGAESSHERNRTGGLPPARGIRPNDARRLVVPGSGASSSHTSAPRGAGTPRCRDRSALHPAVGVGDVEPDPICRPEEPRLIRAASR